ncbi:NADH dehydrogenase FAD-containing subunit [Salsuginibacillus halophilus]|uniref:NADH dehydrogenase FAD-containing subunit n=1 Tax=Salsuginibacillus halophilus TaxID=517424 RepID=A0A2P8H8R0_9BACI|nr:FAD-dependent oxidoreductase [Salsuginibacillus halophilus]PSL42608.1 NADH dehydrogenase FAD-containing subunit [Salsuginibacillus halophilus]
MAPTIVLAGAGHAHLLLLYEEMKSPVRAAEYVLISPNRYQYYSGMYAGYIEGVYEKDETRVDVAALCSAAGIRFIEAAVTSVDAKQKQVHTSTEAVSYDKLSLNLGAASGGVPGIKANARSIKPSYLLPKTAEQLDQAGSIIIAGGGAAGVETALALKAKDAERKSSRDVTILTSSTLLPEAPAAAQKKIRRELSAKGVLYREHTPVTNVASGRVDTPVAVFSADEVLWLAGAGAPAVIAASGLADKRGFLPVTKHLQYQGDPDIFGAGDCVTFLSVPSLAKNGVYAIRQAPILRENLKRSLAGKNLQPFQPQRQYMAILSLGGRRAFMFRGRHHARGRLVWQLKDRIDRKFMDQLHKAAKPGS